MHVAYSSFTKHLKHIQPKQADYTYMYDDDVILPDFLLAPFEIRYLVAFADSLLGCDTRDLNRFGPRATLGTRVR